MTGFEKHVDTNHTRAQGRPPTGRRSPCSLDRALILLSAVPVTDHLGTGTTKRRQTRMLLQMNDEPLPVLESLAGFTH